MRRHFSWSALLLSLALAGGAWARLEPVHGGDFANQKLGKYGRNLEVVEDAAAPGGKAALILYRAGDRAYPMAHTPKPMMLSGPVRVEWLVRGEGFTGIAEQLLLTANFRNESTHQNTEVNTLPHGVRLNDRGYVTLAADYVLPPEPAPYNVYGAALWLPNAGEPAPKLWVGKLTVFANGNSAPYIAGVVPEKVSYHPRERIRYTVVVANPTSLPVKLDVRLTERWGLSHSEKADDATVKIPAGERREVELSWRAGKVSAGREFYTELLLGNKVLDTWTDHIGVAELKTMLATIPRYIADGPRRNFNGYLYVGPATAGEVKLATDYLIGRRVQRYEAFSWTYNELGQMLPPPDEDPFLGNEGIWWQSAKKQREMFRRIYEAGINMETYINGHVWGPAAYTLFQRHPERFIYQEDGALYTQSYDMEWRERYKHRDDFGFKQEKRPFFYANLNPLLPENRRWIADQVLSVADYHGFRGARWDVWNMNVSPDEYDMFGNPLATDWPDADRKSAESIAAVKALVAEKYPGFTWGYNYCSPEENAQTPLIFAEKCRGGGWMLDEVICNYQSKTSPYHIWSAYRDRIVGWGNEVLRYGGVYNPFAFRRGGGAYAVDRLYEGIFRIVGSGRDGGFFSSNASLAGRLGLLAFRYNDCINGWNLRLQDKDQKLVTVQAPDTVWWQTMVFTNVSPDNVPQTIVHLVNSPMVEEVEENPASLVRPPVADIPVRAATRDGKLPTRAWLLAAEPLTADGEPKVQAVPLPITNVNGQAQVTVPLLFYWKVVVFEYPEVR